MCAYITLAIILGVMLSGSSSRDQEVKDLQAALETERNEVKTQKDSVQTEKEKVQEQEQNLRTVRGELANETERAEVNEAKAQRLSGDLGVMNIRITELNSQLREEKRKWNEEKARLESEKDAICEEVANEHVKKKAREDAQNEKNAAWNAAEEAKAEARNAVAEAEREAQRKITQAETRDREAKSRIAKADKQWAEAERLKADLHEEIDRSAHRITLQLKQETDMKQREFEEKIEQLERQRSKMQQAESEYNRATAVAKSREESAERKENEAFSWYQGELNRMNVKTRQLESDLNNLRNELSRAKSEASIEMASNASVRRSFERVEERTQRAQNDLTDLGGKGKGDGEKGKGKKGKEKQ